MKKFTLLAIAALAAAGTQMVNAEEINGITVSTAENPVYYTITNMRANRMSYVKAEHGDSGEEAGGQIMSENDGEGEWLRTDTSGGPWLPTYLPDGADTPEIWSFPYMGLAEVNDKFWTAFSAMPEVMNPRTIYWWFEYTGTGKSVYIHNAVMDGALKQKAEEVGSTGKFSMSFSEQDKEKYFVIPLTEEQLEDLFPDGDEFAENAFAFSKNSIIANKNNEATNLTSCLDMNNYITFNYEADTDETETVQERDENGELVFDEEGEPVMVEQPIKARYGFAGVNLCWNPLRTEGNNRSDNNGSLFQVKKVEDKDLNKVQEAIDYYKEIVKQSYRNQVSRILEEQKESTVNRLGYLSNLPELYGEDKAEKLEAIIADINNMTVDPSAVETQKDVDTWEARIKEQMETQYYRAIALAGNGTVITLQQMLAIRDFASVDDSEGNFYLSATGEGQIKFEGNLETIGYAAVTCVEEETDACKWTMEWVPGEGYKLKNGENYIRQFGNWKGMEQEMIDAIGWEPEEPEEGEEEGGEEGEEEGGEEGGEGDETPADPYAAFMAKVDKNVMTWALTKDASLAAVFSFSCNPTAVQEINLSDADQELVDLYGEELDYDIEDPEAENYIKNTTNIIHLQSTDPEGNPTYLCRDSASWEYIVDSWAAGNQYFAAPNCWKVKVTTPGEEIQDGIEEINATAKVAGIYDLQGRKVAKAGKGLYIINGVKTLVK